MKTLLRRILCIGLLLSSSVAPRALAQEQRFEAVQFQSLSGYVWTGEKSSGAAEPARSARDLRKELAAIQVSIDVERKLDAASKQLDDLAIRATRRGYSERQDVLVEIALARAATFEALGKREQALAAANNVLPASQAPDSPYKLVAANEEDVAMAAKAAADPRLLALRTRIEGAAAPAQGDTSDAIAKIVRDAVEHGANSLTADLGDRALPALEQLTAENLDSLPQYSCDPLRIIIDISQSRAAEFALANFDRGGPIWKARILRAMRTGNGVFNASGAWRVIGNGPERELAYPQWVHVVERLLDEPTTAREALSFVRDLVRFDALTSGLQQRVARILKGADATLASAAISALYDGRGRPSAMPIFEAGLTSSNADVRKFAAVQLGQYASSTALVEASASSDPMVRVQVAKILRSHEVTKVAYDGRTESTRVSPTLTPQQIDVLARLLKDTDSEVRAEAATSLLQVPAALDGALYETIAKDPEPRVRNALLYSSAPTAVRAGVAVLSAASLDPELVKSFDSFVLTRLAPDDRISKLDPAYLPAIEARLRNPAPSFDIDSLFKHIVKGGFEVTAMVHWSLDPKIHRPVHFYTVNAFESLVGKRTATYEQPYPRATTSLSEQRIDLTPVELAEFFSSLLAQGGLENSLISNLTNSLILLSDDLSSTFLPIVRDAQRPFEVRLAALDIAARGPGEQVSACLLDLASDPQAGALPQQSSRFGSIGNAMQGESARKLLEIMVTNTKLHVAVASQYVRGYTRTRPLDARTADRVLSLWFDASGAELDTLRSALDQVASRPREQQGDWLVRAVHDERLWWTGLRLIGDLRDPSYLGVLEEGLTKGYGGKKDVKSVRESVLNSLTRYFDDAAAGIILKAAGSTADAACREECFKALEIIRQYQEEKGRWDGERLSREATASAVRDLVALLEDTSATVRAQAVRGLGTLHAVEQMPRIVRMLKDADEGVRKAAEETLGILNAPPAKKD